MKTLAILLTSLSALGLAAAAPAAAQDTTLQQVEAPQSAFEGERSKDIAIAQVLLARAGHSPGVIDGYSGGNTSRAIAAFRAQQGLGSGSALDDATRQALGWNNRAATYRTYTISADDVAGPFRPTPSSMAAMAELDRIPYEDALEALAERFHMSQGFLKALNPTADFSSPGTQLIVVDVQRPSLSDEVTEIVVSKANNELTAYDRSGNVVATFPATVGSSSFPSPSGTKTVAAIATEPNYSFQPDDQDWGGDEALVLPPGPNNPIGSTWIDLGGGGYGIHGTPKPGNIGKTASHGCVRLTNWDADLLVKAVVPGTTTVRFE